MKYSKEMLLATASFLRTVKEHVGSELGEEKVNAMLDAFDPTLKSQLLMAMLLGDINICILARDSVNIPVKKISAIRAVRTLTGFGLKEAKDIVDDTLHGPVTIEGSYSAQELSEFRKELVDTGYHMQ